MNSNILRYFHPLMATAALGARPRRVTIAESHYVVFRGAGNQPAALDDLCPHRHAPLSMGRVDGGGRIACPYHGWNFDAQGHGASPSCPELRHCDTRAYQVRERFGYLWIASLETPLSAFPTLGWNDYVYAGSISALARAGLELTLDNISEDEHFPFIHTSFGWNAERARDVTVETRTAPDHSTVRYSGQQRASAWAPLGGVRQGDRFHNHWITRFDPVHAVYTFGWDDAHDGAARPVTTRAAVFLVPEAAAATRIHMFLFLRIAPSIYRVLRPALALLARTIAATELRRDIRLIEAVAQAPHTLSGMRLSRFDKALIHNRKLLQSLYWGDSALKAIHPSEEIP